MASRSSRAEIARETLDILGRGSYAAPDGREVPVLDDLAAARAGTVLYRPDDFDEVFRLRDEILRGRVERPVTEYEVANETTLAASRRLIRDGEPRVLALNFASAKNPGGGFLNGSQAQEESIARASGLYPCINGAWGYYEANRWERSCLYTDHVIYSPDVPAFRDDDDDLLDEPFHVSILTAPAPNAGAVRRNEPREVDRIGPTMRSRMDKVLALAVAQGHEALVLGAWGCGVFGNDPDRVALWFVEHLKGTYRTAFRRVAFAVLDRTDDRSTIGPFVREFGEH